MKIRLLYNRVLVERAKPPEKIENIFVPQSWLAEQKDKTTEGIVLAVGPGRYKKNSHTERLPMLVKPGDRVWFHERAGDEGKAKSDSGEMKNFFFLWPDEIIAVDSSRREEKELEEVLASVPAEAVAEIREQL